ncbi:hypothetical protein, partial [Aeromonas sobria]|uniref:hypothetical protein n=1 Tax=Aeromonas sobria TaxID=646 RepID=UPI0019D61AE8
HICSKKRKKKLKSVAMFQRKIPTQVGIFLLEIQYSNIFSCHCGELSSTSYRAHRHTATPPQHLLYSALPGLPHGRPLQSDSSPYFPCEYQQLSERQQ